MVSLEDRVLITGGETAPPPLGGSVLTDTWTFVTATGWSNHTRCPSPPWGWAAYDVESDKVILAGETHEGWAEVHEVWAFDPPSGEWVELEPSSGPDRFGWMAYDAESDRVIVLGPGAETWAYDYNTNEWEEMAPTLRPPDRWEEAMVYDSGSDRVVLFGGYGGNLNLGDTWVYDYNLDTWTEMTPAEGPQARSYPAMAYHPVSDRVYLYGGEAGSTLGDTWAYDFEANSWTDLAPVDSPGIRSWHSMAHDASSGLVVLFGGAPIRDPVFQNDTWLHDPEANNWTVVP
jgi:hypothetical protein